MTEALTTCAHLDLREGDIFGGSSEVKGVLVEQMQRSNRIFRGSHAKKCARTRIFVCAWMKVNACMWAQLLFTYKGRRGQKCISVPI